MSARNVPFESRMIRTLAAALVPSFQRREWRDRWDEKLESWWYFNRDFPAARGILFREALGAVPDALWRRLDREEAPRRLRLAVGSPILVTAILVLALVSIGYFSGFRETHAIAANAGAGDRRLVLLSNHSPFLGYASGVPSTRFVAWARYQKSLEAYAAYSWGAMPNGTTFARVQPAFFQIMGVRPAAGRFFTDDCFDCAVASDAREVGRTINIDRHRYKVVGATPIGFRFAATRAAYWIPMNLGNLPKRLGVVGRLRAGVSADTAGHDLGVGVMPITRLAVETALFYGVALCLALAFALVRLTYDRTFWAHMSGPFRTSWRFWTFCVVKTGLAISAVILGAIEIRYGLVLTPTGARDPLLLVLATWPLLLAFGATLWWSWMDQRLRCRMCLRRLDLPVHMGVLGASLFDPTGIESVCPVGHGALYQPDTSLSDAAWITLDEFFSTQDR